MKSTLQGYLIVSTPFAIATTISLGIYCNSDYKATALIMSFINIALQPLFVALLIKELWDLEDDDDDDDDELDPTPPRHQYYAPEWSNN